MADSTAEKQRGKPFAPGVSGNPAGRPKGAKHKLQEDFIRELALDFEAHGIAAISEVRERSPAQYLKVIASILPKEVEIKRQSLDDLTDEELSAGLAAVRALVADGVGAGGQAAESQDIAPGVH